jgi:hypothetical protein
LELLGPPLLTFGSPPEFARLGAAAGDESPAAASLAVRSPSTSCRWRAATHPGGNQPPGTCPLSVSHALEAFFRPSPAGLVSCRSRPWGSALQGTISTCRAGPPSRGPLPSCGSPITRIIHSGSRALGTPETSAGDVREPLRSSAPSNRFHFRASIPAGVRILCRIV